MCTIRSSTRRAVEIFFPRGRNWMGSKRPRLYILAAQGFIGSWVCKRLVASGFTVTNLDKLTYAANLASLIHLSSKSVTALSAATSPTRSWSGQFYATGGSARWSICRESHVDRSISAPADFIQTNIVGTFNLLRTVADYVDDLRPPCAPTSAFFTCRPMKCMAASAMTDLSTRIPV